jgi:alkanesulfonate monooxygenase SsuD/methylene tetrahydromethanopterin reductase-like flavin-dependent oxidoreductase (luciferase family)
MTVRFSALVLQVMPYPAVRDAFQFVESIGFDAAWIADQAGLPSRPSTTFLEAWTTLAALAGDTERIRIGPLVTNVATRNPVMLGKAVLTVDQVSSGRINLGLGAGYFSVEHGWLGIDFPDGPARSRRLAEAVEILDLGLRGQTVTFDGEFFHHAAAPFNPPPTQQPRVPLYVAGQTRASLAVAVRHADAAVTTSLVEDPGIKATVDRFRDRMRLVDELCEDAGREPANLGRLYSLGYSEEGALSTLDSTAEWIGRLVEAGATEISVYLAEPDMPGMDRYVENGQFADRERLARIAEEIMPRYR